MREAVWAFDIDGCLVDSLSGTSLRPGARELLTQLRGARVSLVVWSAGGADYAEQVAIRLGFDALIDAFHGKDARGPDGRFLADHLATDVASVVFVDDRPEDLPVDADVIAVSPYVGPSRHDRGLAGVARRATELSAVASAADHARARSLDAGAPPRSRRGSDDVAPRPRPG